MAEKKFIPDDEQVDLLSEELRKAKALLHEGAYDGPGSYSKDLERCLGCKFQHHNRHLPATHPAWAVMPAHVCWTGRVKNFLKG
jgi:hypothetical protein